MSKICTSTVFNGRDFYTWSFELGLLLQSAQIVCYFDESYTVPTSDTDDAKAQYYNESLMVYNILLRNMVPAEQLGIRPFKTHPTPAMAAWSYLTKTYQPKDSVSSSRLLQQLMEVKMAPSKKANSYINRCRTVRDQLLKLGNSIPEDMFVTIVLRDLGPQRTPFKSLLRQQGIISEAHLCATLLHEQQDMGFN
ncbi:unnamed protein product [Closterium sp. NIES-54]